MFRKWSFYFEMENKVLPREKVSGVPGIYAGSLTAWQVPHTGGSVSL